MMSFDTVPSVLNCLNHVNGFLNEPLLYLQACIVEAPARSCDQPGELDIQPVPIRLLDTEHWL